ncbi:SMI1/KNR4 family protein [Endobacterium cereale]|nr:SMI1/KNR4 family protein [Endobacterium cereale]MEB2847783.1 SMI1/KNR4 family protein [Endobacterium cereale]
MYLAKFFHKHPGDDDRLLLLAYDTDILMGIYLREPDTPALDWSLQDKIRNAMPKEFLREEFANTAESIAAFRREAEKLLDAGYIETHHTQYTLRKLNGDFTPKPDWQKAIDEAIMSALANEPDAQADRLRALKDTPAETEPVLAWLRAYHANAISSPETLKLAEAASGRWMKSDAGSSSRYLWSIHENHFKGEVFELLALAYLSDGAGFDPKAALDAIITAKAADWSRYRLRVHATIICNYFPEQESDAYDLIYRSAGLKSLAGLTARPSYQAYARYRAADTAARRATWRWSGTSAPADEASIAEAERKMGFRYPEDYRQFLMKRGESTLFVRMPDEDTVLKFAGPAQQIDMRADFLRFVNRMGDEDAAEAFREDHGVSVDHLIPIAEPAGASNLLLLHTEPGERYGRCYVWNHDGLYELVYEQPSFAVMKDRLLRGIMTKDEKALDLFNIYPPDDEENADDDD